MNWKLSMLMSSEKELSIILKRWGIKYSIQLTFMECLLWACCWVRLINISWTWLICGERKYWLLLFVPSVILPSSLYWMDTIARIIQTFNKFVCACMCVCACTPLYLIVSLLLQWLSVTSSVMFTHLSLAFVTANFISYSSSTHPRSRHAHGLGIPLVWQLILSSVPSPRFPSFIYWCIHLTNRHWAPLMLSCGPGKSWGTPRWIKHESCS